MHLPEGPQTGHAGRNRYRTITRIQARETQ